MSCSEDGSVRIWDTEALTQRTVLKPTLSKPGRFTASACAYNSDGGMIAAGLKDGSIQMWDVRGAPPLPIEAPLYIELAVHYAFHITEETNQNMGV